MLTTAVVGTLVLAGSAVALGPPQSPSSNPVSPSNAATWSFSWSPPADPDPLGGEVTYIGGLTATEAEAPTGVVAPGEAIPVPAEARFFRVAAVQDVLGVPVQSDYATLPILPDRVAPLIAVSLVGTPTAGGWYRNAPGGGDGLVIRRTTCTDGLSGLADPNACNDVNWNQDGIYPAGTTVTVTDQAGNSASATTPAFKFDRTQPQSDGGAPSDPGPQALVADEPRFEWTPGVDATSGVARYELQYREATADEWTTIANVPHAGGAGNYSARRDAALLAEPLPEKTLLRWRVRTFDAAGNVRNSVDRGLTIDSTIPPAPSITGGPNAPTRTSSPTFSWTGTEQTYLWDVTIAGSENPVRRGGGPATQTTLSNLPDGDYTFRVTQVTAAGRESAEATRSFKVDTTPPAAPGILVRPPFPAIAAPVFTWETEPGAYSRWTVVGEGGITIIAATDTPTTSVTLPVLPDGAYGFQVQQIDAAGNVSPVSAEPFTMIAPLTPAPGPSSGAGGLATILPRQNALRLKPKAGKVIPTRAPVLQWKRGPRGTKLYNLQIFRVTARKGSRTPKITKVLSLFPRGLQFRAPKKDLRASTCYVWRVWPYTGRAFTPKPIGVSNFCVASAKVLKKKEAAARSKRLAAARRAAEARRR